MRVLVDYRPALRERTGVGEYIHELVRAYAASRPASVTLFTSSWKHRLPRQISADLGVDIVDVRIPVRLLNLLWHRAGWPPVEALAGAVDVAHAAHPLLIPSRRAARLVTIHDLFFLDSRAETRAEIRRDYAALAETHARRADAIVTSTEHGRNLVADRFGVPLDRIYVCAPGAPRWRTLGRAPNVPSRGHVLFMGTLEPRKNVGALLDAYVLVRERLPSAPPLVLAGRGGPQAHEWLTRIARPPLAGHATHLGYVPDADRERIYADARVLVLPSLDEGFGLPALEAMSAGIPVVVSNRGSLPEVVGTAGTLVDPHDIEGLASALVRLLSDDAAAARAGAAGLVRARDFTWSAAAATLHRAYTDAVERRRHS